MVLQGIKVTTIAEHAVCLDELRKPANILDLGCRDFQFTTYFDKRGDFVIPVDIDPKLEGDRQYLNMAITDYTGLCGIKRTSDAQATKMSRVIGEETVQCTTLEKLMENVNIPYFDLIKSDIESAEYEVIMSLTRPPSKQISIEFHLHTGGYSKSEVSIMVAKLHSLGYKTITHELTQAHGMGWNFWSSLFMII